MAVLFRIGARGSKLSLAQTELVRAALASRLRLALEQVEVAPIVTSGDRIQDNRLIEAGGKGLFTKELDDALLNGSVDVAVHSLKDLPTKLPAGVVLACVPEREDPRDAFVSPHAKTLKDLPMGATLGTASLRRQAQALHGRPDLSVVTLRGNVDTRLQKLAAGVAHATFLAVAGLKRLGLQDRATSLIDPRDMPPAACQGALAITAREDARVSDILDALRDYESKSARVEIECERAFLEALDGSCRTAIGALARVSGNQLAFIGEALTPDGTTRWRREETIALGANAIADARALALQLGQAIRDEAGDALVTDAS